MIGNCEMAQLFSKKLFLIYQRCTSKLAEAWEEELLVIHIRHSYIFMSQITMNFEIRNEIQWTLN